MLSERSALLSAFESSEREREIGESAGLTRFSINRQLSAWREHGLIDDGCGSIFVPDMEALRVAVKDFLT